MLFVGARRIGPAPALGGFLEPAHGVWALERGRTGDANASAQVPGLGAEVEVVYDDRAVPHIFAATESDAIRALGYVVARDRQFQLYAQTMAASGRLSELGGRAALGLDREMRDADLMRAADRRTAQSAADTSRVARLVRAYADGVNAYRATMPASAMPLEFRLLGVTPPQWTVRDSYLLFGRMGWTLASIATETSRAAAAARVGSAAAAGLFPDAYPIVEPIQPNGQTAPRIDRVALAPPGAPDTSAVLLAAAPSVFMPSLASTDNADEPRQFASNNWAVAPSRSANGHALLAGDPHLDLTLPSIWYEVHLVVPGVLDVYGVTIPGLPSVVIGFNRDVAWTFTNTGADVADFYAEQVDDLAHPTRYRVDGVWRTLDRHIEQYRGRRGEVLATDTTYSTHRGPMRRVRDRWLSMRWTVLEGKPSEFEAFYQAGTVRSAAAFEAAMGGNYLAPAQNMLAADRGGHIAIQSTGRFPLRQGDGSGAVVRDGSLSASDWTGSLPVARYPHSLDPAQGYLASANQQPIDPRTTNDWWGGSYDPWRALRINALLRADSSVTVDDMRRFQTDGGSSRAELFAPAFVRASRRVLARGGAGVDRPRLARAESLLTRWNMRYAADDEGPVLFEAAMRELTDRTWDELTDEGSRSRRTVTPSAGVLAALLADSTNIWWDDRSTAPREDRDDILTASLAAALESVESKYGRAGARWRWSTIRHANINHLLRVPALSALDVPVTGSIGTLSPSAGAGTHGASWRMVVDLGPKVRAWTVYPGGQSGDPASTHYRDRIEAWRRGELSEVRYPASPAALTGSARAGTLRLVPTGAR